MNDLKTRRLDFYNPQDPRPFDRTVARSFGQRLKAHRESLGITLSDVSKRTKIGIHNLEAIDNGDFHHVPQALYLRSFLKKYADAVEFYFDPDTLWDSLYSQSLVINVTITKSDSTVQVRQAQKADSPPRLAEYLLYLFLSKAERIYLVGDLREEYAEVLEKFGVPRAKLWFYKQVIDSLGPLISRSFSKLRLVVQLVELYNRLHR